MPTTVRVARADLTFESAFAQPEFSLFRDTPALLAQLFNHLREHGPQLQNMRIERGDPSIGEFHVACHLYDLRVGVRVYTEKVGVACINVLDNEVQRVSSVIADALAAIKAHQPSLAFRTHTLTVAMHGTLEGKVSVKEYLSTFIRNVPTGLGPATGSGGVMYFGPEEDRILSAVTVDLSAIVSDGLFVRPHVVWDGSKVDIPALPLRATAFVRQALHAFGLEVPSLKGSP